MDEDEYVAKVEKIIERDFFPELEKLKAQSEGRRRVRGQGGEDHRAGLLPRA